MRSSAPTAPLNQESALLDYVERLRKFKPGRRAVHAKLSKLRPYHRRSQHLRIAASTFEPLVRDFEGAVFQMFNDDLVVLCNGATVADIDRSVLHLRYLFIEDPLLKDEEAGGDLFCDWFDLETQYQELLDLSRHMVEARAQYDSALRNRPAPLSNKADQEPAPTVPLDANRLAVIQSAIAQADLSTMFRRQPICAVSRDHEPMPVFFEIFTSIESLRRTLMPKVDIHANRWLFQDLTQHLDRRMIAYLSHSDDGELRRAFSLNLNVTTLLSHEFLDFDAAHNNGSRSIIIELQPIDVFTELASYQFARDFLRERGYKFCLDGMTHLSLPLINRQHLGFDLVKLVWSPEMVDLLNSHRGDLLRQAAAGAGSERLILTHCDCEQALEIGRSLGITLYQGRWLDDIMAHKVTREDSVHALAEALARHRAASRG